jgi:hypothetical protein
MISATSIRSQWVKKQQAGKVLDEVWLVMDTWMTTLEETQGAESDYLNMRLNSILEWKFSHGSDFALIAWAEWKALLLRFVYPSKIPEEQVQLLLSDLTLSN